MLPFTGRVERRARVSPRSYSSQLCEEPQQLGALHIDVGSWPPIKLVRRDGWLLLSWPTDLEAENTATVVHAAIDQTRAKTDAFDKKRQIGLRGPRQDRINCINHQGVIVHTFAAQDNAVRDIETLKIRITESSAG